MPELSHIDSPNTSYAQTTSPNNTKRLAEHSNTPSIDDDDDDSDITYVRYVKDIFDDKRYDLGQRTWRAHRQSSRHALQDIVDIIGPYAYYGLMGYFTVAGTIGFIVHPLKLILAFYCYYYNYHYIFPISTILTLRFVMDSIVLLFSIFPVKDPFKYWRPVVCLDIAQMIIYSLVITTPSFQNAAGIPWFIKYFSNFILIAGWIVYLIAFAGMAHRYITVPKDDFHPGFVTRTAFLSQKPAGKGNL